MHTDDLPDVDFGGIPPDCLREVPLDVQRAVAETYRDIRVLWNAKIHRLQLCVRAEGSAMAYYEGLVLSGWLLLGGDFPHATTGHQIVEELRRRENFNAEGVRKMGYESVEDLLADAWPKLERQLMSLVEADAARQDRLFFRGMTMGNDGSPVTLEKAAEQNAKDAVAQADAVNPNRHLRPGRKSFSLTTGGVLIPN